MCELKGASLFFCFIFLVNCTFCRIILVCECCSAGKLLRVWFAFSILKTPFVPANLMRGMSRMYANIFQSYFFSGKVFLVQRKLMKSWMTRWWTTISAGVLCTWKADITFFNCRMNHSFEISPQWYGVCPWNISSLIWGVSVKYLLSDLACVGEISP